MCKDIWDVPDRPTDPPEDPVRDPDPPYDKELDPHWGKTVEEIADELCQELRNIAK